MIFILVKSLPLLKNIHKNFLLLRPCDLKTFKSWYICFMFYDGFKAHGWKTCHNGHWILIWPHFKPLILGMSTPYNFTLHKHNMQNVIISRTLEIMNIYIYIYNNFIFFKNNTSMNWWIIKINKYQIFEY